MYRQAWYPHFGFDHQGLESPGWKHLEMWEAQHDRSLECIACKESALKFLMDVALSANNSTKYVEGVGLGQA